MSESDPPPVSLPDSILATIAQVEEDNNNVLSEAQLDVLMNNTKFMRTSFKSMSGVFVDNDDRIQVVRVIGQMAEDFDLMGSLKYKLASDVRFFFTSFLESLCKYP